MFWQAGMIIDSRDTTSPSPGLIEQRVPDLYTTPYDPYATWNRQQVVPLPRRSMGTIGNVVHPSNCPSRAIDQAIEQVLTTYLWSAISRIQYTRDHHRDN